MRYFIWQLCSALFAFWIFGLIPMALIFFATIHWDHSFGHPPYVVWILEAAYLVIGVLLFRGATNRPDKATARAQTR